MVWFSCLSSGLLNDEPPVWLTIIMVINVIMRYLWSASFKTRQIYHVDIWPMLTSVEANIRVPYWGLGPIPFFSTEFQFLFFPTSNRIPQLTMSYKSNSNSDDFNFEDFNCNLNFNISQSSSQLSMVIITWYIELLISLYHISFLFPFIKDCNFMVSCLIKYHDLLQQHRCHYLNQDFCQLDSREI